MPFTFKSGGAGSIRSARRPSTFTSGALARSDLLLHRVLLCGVANHRLEDLGVGCIEIRREGPLGAVPRLDPRDVRSGVIAAARGERPHGSAEPEIGDALLVELEVLEPVAHLLAG